MQLTQVFIKWFSVEWENTVAITQYLMVMRWIDHIPLVPEPRKVKEEDED